MLAGLLLMLTPVTAAPPPTPLVIAHRGASGLRPEHTLEAYRVAIAQGADFIEPDLVMTKDGVLVARHENEIGGTTDVAAKPEFAARKVTKTIDGQAVSGWFTEDFTLAELKTLRARERLPELRPGNTAYDGKFDVPTFDEILALLDTAKGAQGQRIGVYPEIKHGAYFDKLGLNMEVPLLAALARYGLTRASDPVFIQSFEVGNLERLRTRTKLRLIQLIDATGGPADRPGTSYAAMLTPAGLKAVARRADGIGPNKLLILPRGADGRSNAATTLVADAHRAGLKVHPWTFRRENPFLPAELRVTPGGGFDDRGLTAELMRFYTLGVDAVFSDFPREAVEARRNWCIQRVPVAQRNSVLCP